MLLSTHKSEVRILSVKKAECSVENHKNIFIQFKADDEAVAMLKECSKMLSISKAEVMRLGVHRMYEKLLIKKEAAPTL